MKNEIKRMFRILPDSMYIQIMYYYHFHRFVNLSKPKTFNEKMQWLKLHDRNSSYIKMVDKYLVKDYVADKIGKGYIIPTLGVWDRPEDIEFEKLPNEFVLKWNHDSGSIVFCDNKDNFDIQAAIEKLKKGVDNTGYWYGREWPYKAVEPKIIAEPYMKESKSLDLTDYKVHCFNGKPEVILVCKDRYSKTGMTEDFFDVNWKHLPIAREKNPNSKEAILAPKNLERMIQFATLLSKDIKFLRVDFYEIEGSLFFGELTFYPGSGFIPFIPEEWDLELGKNIRL